MPFPGARESQEWHFLIPDSRERKNASGNPHPNQQTLLLVGCHAAPPPFGTVFPHLYAMLIVSLVLGLSSRLTCLQDFGSLSAVHASDTIYRVLSRVINSLLTYLLTYISPGTRTETDRQTYRNNTVKQTKLSAMMSSIHQRSLYKATVSQSDNDDMSCIHCETLSLTVIVLTIDHYSSPEWLFSSYFQEKKTWMPVKCLEDGWPCHQTELSNSWVIVVINPLKPTVAIWVQQ